MNKLYDVIIVGAGPSGSSCAYNLKRSNPKLSVLLLDKAEFPRYKPCGGGISPEVCNYLDFDLSEAINFRCQEVVMVAKGKKFASNKHELWLVRREVFDDFLLEKAKDSGVEFSGNCTVNGVTQLAEHAVVYSSCGELLAKTVVIAEGGRGKLAKQLGFASDNTVLAAMEYEHYTTKLDGKLYIDFDYNSTGYAWNFPKSDGLSLGIGGLIKGQAKGNVSLPKKLLNYSAQFEVMELAKQNLHGHPIQLYSGRKKLVNKRVILIGEIAGCVDPLTAEGIRPAIKSGYLAAKSLVSALEAGQINLLRDYERAFHQQIGKDFQPARLMAYFMNRHLNKVLAVISSQKAIDGFMAVFSGKTTYRQKINLRRVAQIVGKILWK